MSKVQIGTGGYMYPFVPTVEKVQIGTPPFRVYLNVPTRNLDLPLVAESENTGDLQK